MKHSEFVKMVQDIVKEAHELCDKHTTEKTAPVNYACIFAQSEEEYDTLLACAQELGTIVQEKASGLVFQIRPLDTVAGKLEVLKIRKPDAKRPEQGDADFTVSDYVEFKKAYLGKPGFDIIVRADMEMMELADPAFNVLAYFSHPPLFEVLGLTHK
ncbi:MAG: hypothetical protein A3A33_02330 [Candidatus Yanofskybacteria bacterium RIFCSPLOWO2_01_FULL_49_25]|uniref:Uncharacterized protein n=1 Tax=Candidatus Yanofskybacteria bacterium RIFCSPLOWO2_01_FULL_49_25 TaxID=1802701 RepID=A0A1F8GUQ7_9BACT|nr:MAG: hypothetical protein A3A33_02330 [Candidatus Yanofskybacteria bacterium RIFCSPLOWO2_01_FULL_49_25]